MKRKNIYLIFGIVVLLVIIGIVYVNNNQNKEEIVIGALFPLSGGLAQYGEVAQKSAMIAVDEINSNGGINGKKFIIDYQDHQCLPQTAVSIFEQLYSVKNERIFTSVACSGTVLSLAPILNEKKAVLLGTLVTTPKITNVSKYVFRNWASDDKEAKLFSELIRKNGYKKVGVIYEETDYAKGLKLSIDKYLNNSGIIIVSESFTSDATDLRTQLTKLKSENPDALFLSPQTVTTGDKILKQINEIGFNPKQILINDNIVKSWTLLQTYNKTLEGAIGADYSPDLVKSEEFLKKYKEKYGIDCPQPNVGASVYDAIYMLKEAISKEGYEADKVRDYLKNINYNGISGIIMFDQNNDRDNAEYTLFIVKGGKAVEIK